MFLWIVENVYDLQSIFADVSVNNDNARLWFKEKSNNIDVLSLLEAIEPTLLTESILQ